MSANGKTLYIIDDSPFLVARIEALLEEIDVIAYVRSAMTYSDAVELVSEKEPDIVLLDIHLSDKSGIDLLKHLRQHHTSVTVIMLSNQSTAHYRDLCRTLGASHFIDKSTEFDELPQILEALP